MSPESFACRGDKKCVCCLPETFMRLLLQISSRATTFPVWLNWRHQGDINVVRDMSPSLARPSLHLELRLESNIVFLVLKSKERPPGEAF